MTVNEAALLGDKIVQSFLENNQLPWSGYGLDLFLEGVAALYHSTGNDAYKRLVLETARARDWSPDKQPAGGGPPFTLLVFEVFRLSGNPEWEQPFIDESRAYMRRIQRNADGVILHRNARRDCYSILIDSLQEYAQRMAKAGGLACDNEMMAECATQYRMHRELLRDPDSGLWSQGIGWEGDDAKSPGAWSRGHGWLVRGLVESLLYLPRDSEYYESLHAILVEMLEVLLPLRDESGMWHALPHLPLEKSRAESSGSALIAGYMARAIHAHILPEKPYKAETQKTLASLHDYVNEKGDILSSCPGPGPLDSNDLEKYIETDFPAGDSHGAGAMLIALAGEMML